jgi:hypothetical protein
MKGRLAQWSRPAGYARVSACVLAVGVAATLLTLGHWAVAAGASSAMDANPPESPSPSERPVRAGPAARADSRTAYRNQTAPQALQTLKDQHPSLLQPAWRALKQSPAPVDAYLSDHAAQLDLGGGHRGLAESVLPLRARDSSGGRVPTDLGLDDRGSFLAPQAALVRLRLPKHLADGIELPDVGIGLVPADAASGASAQSAGGSVFWANGGGVDTDVIATPLPWGVQLLGHLRSVDSPEDVRLRLVLPAGVRAEGPGAQGEIALKRGAEVLAQVSPPLVYDADGVGVPASYSLDGDMLTVHVAHREADVRYPLVLDPVVVENQQYWNSNAALDHAGWTPLPAASDGWFDNYYANSYFGWGLYTKNCCNTTYPGGQQAWWQFGAPGTTSFVYAAEFDLMSTSMQNSCLNVGVWPRSGPAEASWGTCGNVSQVNQLVCVQSGCPTGSGSLGNRAIFLTTMSGTGYRDFVATYFGGAVVYLNDSTPPTATVKSSGAPAGWVDAATLPAAITGYDTGLGVKQFKLSSPGQADRYRTWPCTGDRNGRCPIAWHVSSDDSATSGDPFTYNTTPMPEGFVTVNGQVGDFSGNWSSPVSWQVQVDHSPPRAPLSGSLFDHRGQTLEPGNYVLQIDATDGQNDGNPADARSGVQSINTYVDDTLLPGKNTYGGSASGLNSQSCSAGNCPMSQTVNFPTVAFLPGLHTVRVDAVDQLGHQLEQKFTVTTVAPGASTGQPGYYGTGCDYANGQAAPFGVSDGSNQAYVYEGSGSSGTADAAVGACAYSPATGGSTGVAGETVEAGAGAGKGGSLTNQGPVATPAPPVGVYAVADGDNQNYFGGGFLPQSKSYFGASNYETCPSGSTSCSTDSNSGGYDAFGVPIPLFMCGYYDTWYQEYYDGCNTGGMFDLAPS